METYTSDIDYFKSIDGNMIRNPVGYCTYHRGYVSQRQAMVHKCYRKHGGTCGRLTNMSGRRVRDMKTEQFYDKFLSRMDKMCGSLDKIARMLEAMQKANEMTPLDKALKEAQSMKAEEYLFGKVHKYAEGEKE